MLLLADDDHHELIASNRAGPRHPRPGVRGARREERACHPQRRQAGIEHFASSTAAASHSTWQRFQPAADAPTPPASRSATGTRSSRSAACWVPDPLVKDQGDLLRELPGLPQAGDDVRGFRSGLAGSPPPRADRRGGRQGHSALVVGRFERHAAGDAKEDGWRPAIPNDFDYRLTRRAPAAAARATSARSTARPLVRAGEPADQNGSAASRAAASHTGDGPISRPLEELPSRDVGVLFMCFQASIRRQFAFMQREWANLPWFPKAYVGPDALVGQSAGRPDHTHEWPTTYNVDATRPASFAEFVRMKGGEYFFAPSLPFFANLPDE